MAITTNAEWLELANRFEALARDVANAIRKDDGNGLAVSDLQEALYDFRPVMFEVEVLAGDKEPLDFSNDVAVVPSDAHQHID